MCVCVCVCMYVWIYVVMDAVSCVAMLGDVRATALRDEIVARRSIL